MEIFPRSSARLAVLQPSVRATLTALTCELSDLVPRGWLPPWPQWWGDEALAELIPDQEARRHFAEGCPRLPLAMFEEIGRRRRRRDPPARRPGDLGHGPAPSGAPDLITPPAGDRAAAGACCDGVSEGRSLAAVSS
jgi:hypothetical protein